LLQLLDGLPLAIAQAGVYLQESGIELDTYLRFHEKHWSDLMEMENEKDAPLQDYPNRSVWTTWAISYQAIRDTHEHTANLLLLWSFLDNKDLWYGMFAAACTASTAAARMLSACIGDIAISEVAFSRAMQLLRSYSLVEAVEETKSYATHPVVHRWAYHYQGKHSPLELGRVAVITVGSAVLDNSIGDWSALQRRLLPHARACAANEMSCQVKQDNTCNRGGPLGVMEREEVSGSNHWPGNLCADQGKLADTEQMYKQALQRREDARSDTPVQHPIPALATVESMGNLYVDQEKYIEAREVYSIALPALQALLSQSSDRGEQLLSEINELYTPQANQEEHNAPPAV
jgi:hypothetical protein